MVAADDFEIEPSPHRRQPRHVVARRAFRRAAAEDHVLDRVRLELGALDGVLDRVARHRRAVRVVEAAAARFGETRAGVRDDDGAARHGILLDLRAHPSRGDARAKARIAASADRRCRASEIAWLFTSPPAWRAWLLRPRRGAAPLRRPAGTCRGRDPGSTWRCLPTSTPATMPTSDTVNGLSVEDVVACCTPDAIEKPAMAALAST